MKPRPQAFYLIRFPDSVELFDYHLLKRNRPYHKNIFLAYSDYFGFCLANLYKRLPFDQFLMRSIELGFSCDGFIVEKDYSIQKRRKIDKTLPYLVEA